MKTTVFVSTIPVILIRYFQILPITLVVISQRPDGAKSRDGGNDAEEDVADDGEVRGSNEVGVPFVVAADHDKPTLGQ
jgi:hypothetical protein